MDLKAHCSFAKLRMTKTGLRKELTKTLRIMKITAVLLFVAAMQVSAKSDAQNITLSLKNAPLETVFKEIQKQAGYNFVYNNNVVKESKPVNLSVNQATVEEVLRICFKDQPVTYTIVDRTIVVKPRDPSPLAQDDNPPPPIDVHGRVVNEKGEPVLATVTIKGAKISVSTNDNGEFILKNVDENATIVISGINIETFEVKISGRTDIANLAAKTKVTTEEAVLVNTGYQQLKPNEVTGSMVVITEEQLDQRVAPTIIEKLEGITRGLAFNKNPSTGGNILRINGESTIYANPNPLIIVDNFPYDGDINSINPNDVESITILKDAAAASIWGVQAGNGVIVITTKKGRLKQRLRIELNTNLTVSGKPDLFAPSSIGTSDYIQLETFLFKNGYYNSMLASSDKTAVSPVVEILNNRKLGLISSADSVALISSLSNSDVRNDLTKYIYQKPVRQQYQINLSGGSDKAGYFFSSGFDKEIGSIIENKNNRITLNGSNTFKPFKFIELNTGLFYIETSSANTFSPAIPNLYPYTMFKDNQENDLSVPQHRAIFEDTITTHGFLDWKYYPLRKSNEPSFETKGYDTRLSANLKLYLIKGLIAEASYQHQKVLNKSQTYYSPETYFIRDKYNTFAILNNGDFIGSNYNSQQLNRGLLDMASTDVVSNQGRFSFGYNNRWVNHKISAMVGLEVKETKVNGNSYRLYGYNDETGTFISPNLFTNYPTFPTGSSTIDPPGAGISNTGGINRYRSYFSLATYTYKNRYSLSGSARFDGSNYFGVTTNKKTVPLWSAGLRWDISKEKFFNVKQLPYLSMRMTYGYQGNLDPNLAAVTTLVYRPFPDLYTGLPYAIINNIPNPELRWEKTRRLNLGVDFATRNNILSGTIEYYTKKGDDLIGDALIDPTTGVSQIRGNFSGMKSKGVDFQITSQNINKTLKWNTTLLFSYVTDKVTRYDVPYSGYNTFLNSYQIILPQVGAPLYGLYSYHWGGLDPSTGDPRIIVGDTLNKNYTGTTGSIKLTDLVYSGRYNPPVFGSLLNSLSWKGLSLSFNITYKFNYYFRRSSINNYDALIAGWQRPGTSDFALRWQNSGDETTTNVPSLLYPINNPTREAFYSLSDVLVEKGDHIRLQFVNLSYNLDKDLFTKLPFQQVQIYFYMNNVGILWRANDKHIDPDYPYTLAPNKTYSFGIKTSF